MSCDMNSPPKINRRHSIDFAFDLQSCKPIINSKSEGRNHSEMEPFILSFSDLLVKTKPSTPPSPPPSTTTKYQSCLNTDLVLDNLFANNTFTQTTNQRNETQIETNRFNTDFYKLCSDSFNESNYALTHQNQNSQQQQQQQQSQHSLSLDRFQVSYQF